MKWICFISLLFFQLSGNAQINYSVVFISQCSGQIIDESFEVQDNSGNVLSIRDFRSDQISVPNFGEYILTPLWAPPIHVLISSHDQSDTFYVSNLEIPVCVCSPPATKYVFCEKIAEGYCVDYYAPEVMRREGTFKNGDPIDTVKTYYFSGELMEIQVRKGKGEKSVEFYKNGQIKWEFERSNGFKERTYFPDGQLQIESSYKHGKSRESEFYQNGQLKRKESTRKGVSYSETGTKLQLIHRKGRFSNLRLGYSEFRLRMKKYNDKKEVMLKLRFLRSSNSSPAYPQNLEEIDMQEIKTLIVYQNGKPHQKFIQTVHYVNLEKVFEVVNYGREKHKWVEISRHESDLLLDVMKRMN